MTDDFKPGDIVYHMYPYQDIGILLYHDMDWNGWMCYILQGSHKGSRNVFRRTRNLKRLEDMNENDVIIK